MNKKEFKSTRFYKAGTAFHLLLALIAPMHVLAQYADHRNRKVDSLEHVLKTQKLESSKLFEVYEGLMYGYLQTNGDRSAMYAKKSIALAEEAKLHGGLCEAWRILGLNAYGRCDYDSALHCFGHALDAIELMKDEKRFTESEIDNHLSALYGTLGNLYNIQGKLHLALDYYQKALPIFQRHGWKESETLLYYNVGELYLELGNDKAAADNYRKALKAGEETKDSLIMALPCSGIAMTLLNEGKYKEALHYAERHREYFVHHPAEEQEALLDNYVLTSRIYQLGFKNLAKAQEFMDKALDICQVANGPTNASDAYAQQASLCLERKEWRQAAAWAHKALEANDQDPQHNIGVYETLAEAYAGVGDIDKAHLYIEKLHDTMQEQSTTRYQSALSEMEVRYKTLEKEAQLRDMEQKHRMSRMQNWILLGLIMLLAIAVVVIIIVARQRHRITAMRSRLMGEADERTRLGRDLHDRLGGLLTAIRLQARDKEVEALSLQAAEEMRRVAHHLMPVSLKEYGLVRALSDFCHVHPTVNFIHHGQEGRLTEQQEVMLYCATLELVNNALRYAEASHIMVQLFMDNDYTAIIVSDNGKSPLQLPQGEEPKTGSGLRNIRERAELMGGRMSISSTSEGTEINVEIPR